MRKKILFNALFISIITNAIAQDAWKPSEIGLFNNNGNSAVTTTYVFKNKLYAGTGLSYGKVYSTSSGNPGSWTTSFSQSDYSAVDAMVSTPEGGGTFYVSVRGGEMSTSSVFSTTDGMVWNPYFVPSYTNDPFSFIIPFKGTGTTDSMYVVRNSYYGSIIYKSAFDSNDPNDTTGAWDTVLDLSATSMYTKIKSYCVFNNKLYVGTDQGGKFLSSADGNNWQQDTITPMGFGDMYNTEFSAMAVYQGYMYVGTYNNNNNAQLWKSNDGTTWQMVTQFNGYQKITSLNINNGGNELWVSLQIPKFAVGLHGTILKTTDGATFTTSDNTGFGIANNNGTYGSTTQFGNYIYYNCQNEGSMPQVQNSTGNLRLPIMSGPYGEIWRTCLGTLPTVNLGADVILCPGSNVTFDAGVGATAYLWNDSTTNQTLVANTSGIYSVMVTGANGCVNFDSVVFKGLPSPSVYFSQPESDNVTVCKNDSLLIITEPHSNIQIPYSSPFTAVIHDTIDGNLGDVFDTLAVSGVSGYCACTTLLSVTIDSLDHTYLGDVTISLYNPSGSFINLSINNGGSSNLGYHGTEFRMDATAPIGAGTAPFTGQFLPQDGFGSLYGNPNGNWVLKVGDTYAPYDNGVLKGWTMRFSYEDTIMTYSWTSNNLGILPSTSSSITAVPVSCDVYTLTTTNSSGCTAQNVMTITVPAIHITPATTTLCPGTSTTLNVTGGDIYNWSPAVTLVDSIGSAVTVNPVSTTVYQVNDTLSGCAVSDSVQINVDPQIQIANIASQTICMADTALFTAVVTGGDNNYNYVWDDSFQSEYTSSISVSPSAGTSYTLTVTDALGCYAATSTSLAVTPSTDIYGHVNYSQGNISGGLAVIYYYLPYLTHFISAQIVSIDSAGNYHFPSVNHGDYLIKIFADTSAYPTLIPTYYGNSFKWDSAQVVYHSCGGIDTANITMIEMPVSITGTGFASGRIKEGPGFLTSLQPDFTRQEGDPIPGVDVKLGKNPGGMIAFTNTDLGGNYSFGNLSAGNYRVYIDIPGLHQDSTYTFTIGATTQFLNLDYEVDSTDIYIIQNATTSVNNSSKDLSVMFGVYPNPSKNNVNIEYHVAIDANVNVELFNILGVKTKTVYSGKQTTGDYKFNLNKQNNDMAAGTYFIKLTVDSKSYTQRIVILD
jgi:subtilisin-like proprotein convertase family protein